MGRRLRAVSRDQRRLGQLSAAALSGSAAPGHELVQRMDQPPLGAGEAASSPVPAALANAVFDATRVRMRTVPFTRERVRALMA
jgi:hypothetical protein